MSTIGIRREDKNEWERRAPIVPDHARKLKNSHSIEIIVQPSKIRAFTEEEYEDCGAKISENLKECGIVFGVKEFPISFFEKGKTYVFFSHVIKGQKHNMSMLKKMMELGCNLIDYEKMVDKDGKRVVFFGRWAGLAGMIDTLWAFGKKLYSEGINTPFNKIKRTTEYKDLKEARDEIKKVGDEIKIYGFDEALKPITFSFLGYGHVSQGAQEIFDLLPHETITPKELLKLSGKPTLSRNMIYKSVFKEEDLVKPVLEKQKFDLQDYYKNPDRYASCFDRYIDHSTVIVNGIYWDKRYPRFVTKDYLRKLYAKGRLTTKVLGDITCDIEGSIECNVATTNPGDPVYDYDPRTGKINLGYKGDGVVVLAVDNLPCELPVDSSAAFSSALMPFIPDIVKADYSIDFKKLKLPIEIKKGVILYKGKLTPDFEYISKFL